MSSSFNAMLARGIDSETATRLMDEGFTINKLKTAKSDELLNVGLSAKQIEAVQHGARPPIPPGTLYKLLYESRRICCICREPNRSIIVHHIDGWAESRSHDEDNLVVLCLEHHDLAHTRKDLALTLKPDEIQAAKEQWRNQTKLFDVAAVLGVAVRDQARWDYVNYTRFFELVPARKMMLGRFLREKRAAQDSEDCYAAVVCEAKRGERLTLGPNQGR